MFFKNICVIVLWMKIALLALEGLKLIMSMLFIISLSDIILMILWSSCLCSKDLLDWWEFELRFYLVLLGPPQLSLGCFKKSSFYSNNLDVTFLSFAAGLLWLVVMTTINGVRHLQGIKWSAVLFERGVHLLLSLIRSNDVRTLIQITTIRQK